MSDHERLCQRAGCQQPATVTLSFRYDARQASLVDLSADKDPAFYDLCGTHADVLIVPRGWERLDRRTPPPDPTPEISPADSVGNDPRMDRYAALTAELPRLAEACGLRSPQPHAAAARPARHRMERATAAPHEPAAPEQREASPAGAGGTGGHPYQPVTQTLLPDEVFELDGQLQMPIEQEQQGVVVALTRTRNA
jgi:hypothetical protein